ncbi:hypothetical protein POM88_040368 [Heracleum sosnowskyi]|uniref:Gag protein n=1 Tax=Heracleum sosnowskyi TaxID=360622 RepID=A0AAD8HBX0_9APIA|nr:hypothetical protein POM88_040368 [Heracleum sosnowskyi]
MSTKYESMKIPILKKTEYPTWKVKMLMYLEAMDPDYLDRIRDGPYVPTRIVAQTDTVPEHYMVKVKSEWTPEEKVDVLRDAKIKNILHNSLDAVMSNRVIACKSSKEIWDTLETQCQGSASVKKNRRALLIQEYEQFDARPDESLTDMYDRFLTLLNNLSLVGKEYVYEDSNTKFLRDLPEEWDTKTSIIRHQYDLNTVSLDEVYGMLRTYDLEVQQRKNKKSSKAKSIALNVEAKSKGKAVEVSRRKSRIVESDPDDSSSDTDDNPDANTDDDSSDSDMEEMVAMIVRGFKKMKFRKARRQGNFQKKTFNADKDEYNKKDSKSGKFDKSKVRSYKCNGMGHFATECKKAKALITSNKDWMDFSSESDTEVVNYALMANTDESAVPDDKVLNTVFDFDTDNASELRRFLKSLHISFRSQTAENTRILSEMSELRKRNEHLETEFSFMQKVQIECDNAKHMYLKMKFKCTALEKELEEAKEKIRT